MTKLEQLIKQLCPDGADYKALGEIATIKTGNKPKEILDTPTDIEYINAGTSNSGYTVASNCEGDTVTTPSRGQGGIGYVGYQKNAFWLGPLCYKIRSKNERVLDNRFIYYYLSCHNNQILQCKNEGGTPSVNSSDLSRIRIPVPPLEVQAEIVRILDTFSELTTELTTELTARKKQYAYYREKLLNDYKPKVEIVKVSDLGSWQGGKTPSMQEKRFWENGTIPWISSKDVKTTELMDTEDHITESALSEAFMKLFPEETVVIVTRSGILKHTFPVAYVPFRTTVNQDIKALSVKTGVLPRYAFHVLQAYGEDIRVKAKKQGGTVDSLEFQKVLDYEVPLPDYETQKRLVNVLDNFELICSDLNIGLPAEIEARKKQYEYYRDLLLTFAETGGKLPEKRREEKRREEKRREEKRREES